MQLERVQTDWTSCLYLDDLCPRNHLDDSAGSPVYFVAHATEMNRKLKSKQPCPEIAQRK